MNILISYLSLYNSQIERSYQTNGLCSEKSIIASQTNEPVLKLLKKQLEEKGEKIDTIIPVLSYKAENEKCKALPDKTTYEFYFELTEKVVGTADVLCPVREYADENNIREPGAVIREICDLITADDNIYIDTSGGARTAANMLQLLTKILEYKGYKLIESFYSNINGNEAQIQTTKDFTELTMLADAINEFVHTGRSNQLSECFNGEKHKEIAELMKYMDEFTDRMQLCNVSELDDILTKMRSQIEKVRMIKSDEARIVILGNLLSVIEDKFFEGNSDSIDYCRMIKWCLENGLVQQAVTIYIEKMPKYIFDNQILICDPEYYAKTKKKNENCPNKQNTDAVIFFDEFMDSVSLVDKSDVKRLQNAIKEKFINKNYNFYVDADLKKYMNVFYEIRKSASDDFKGYMRNISGYTGVGMNKTEKMLAEYCVNGGYTNFYKFVNSLCNNEQEVANIMGKKAEKIETLDKKIQTAANITMKNCFQEGVTINKKTDINILRSILFDYIYVKAVRNHINHASDEENLNERQKAIFESRGYNVREFTTKVISNIIQNSVNCIEKTASAVMKG
mgnify:FL=1